MIKMTREKVTVIRFFPDDSDGFSETIVIEKRLSEEQIGKIKAEYTKHLDEFYDKKHIEGMIEHLGFTVLDSGMDEEEAWIVHDWIKYRLRSDFDGCH